MIVARKRLADLKEAAHGLHQLAEARVAMIGVMLSCNAFHNRSMRLTQGGMLVGFRLALTEVWPH